MTSTHNEFHSHCSGNLHGYLHYFVCGSGRSTVLCNVCNSEPRVSSIHIIYAENTSYFLAAIETVEKNDSVVIVPIWKG